MSGVSNPYAAGDKVYNGGSSAATQGAVDPMGYIDRSLNSTPNPGSYTPGVAAGALSTLRGATDTNQSQVIAPTQTPAPTTQASTTGQISWKMPVDYDLQLTGINANSKLQNLMTQLTAQRNAAMQDKVIGQRELGRNEQQQSRRDLNNASFRGMARSSGYVNQVDQTAQTFNNARTDLEARFLAALNGATAQELQGRSEYDDTMSLIYREAAARLAEKRTTDPESGALVPGEAKAPTENNGKVPQPYSPPVRQAPTTPAKSTPKPAPKPTQTPVKKTTTSKTIRAARGESLASLAKKYGVTVKELVRINPQLKRSDGKYVVYANSQVRIPRGGK